VSTEPIPTLRLPGSLAPLGYRNYALYWAGFAAANAGRWIEYAGTLWLVYELTASPLLLGLVGVVRAIPSILLSPIGGVVADRIHPRKLLMVTQASGAVASLVLGTLVVTGQVELWHIYVQVAVQASIRAFDTAARQTLFPELIPRSQLSQAVTLTVTAGRGSRFIGPAIGGILIGVVGVAAPFFVYAAMLGVLMLAVIAMSDIPMARPQPVTTVRSDLAEGLSHLLATPVLRGLLSLEIVFSLLQMNEVMIVIIGREVLDVGPEALGLLISAPALGSMAGIGALLVVTPIRQGRVVILSTLAYSAFLLLVAFSTSYAMTFVALLIVGLFDALVTVTRHSVMQLAAPDGMRGRVMANMNTVTQGVGPLGQGLSGLLVEIFGVPLAIGASAVALGGAAVVTVRNNRPLWLFRRDVIATDLEA
jgi:MFS family permease